VSARPTSNRRADFRAGDLMKRRRAVPVLAVGIAEAAEALGVSQDTFNEVIRPDLRLVRIGRRRLVAITELERWLDENAEHTLGGD
jgi:excisionase family DNA binding protein